MPPFDNFQVNWFDYQSVPDSDPGVGPVSDSHDELSQYSLALCTPAGNLSSTSNLSTSSIFDGNLSGQQSRMDSFSEDQGLASITFSDDALLSTTGSFDDRWNHQALAATPEPLHDARSSIILHTFLSKTHIPILTDITLKKAVYVTCDLKNFCSGIKYGQAYLAKNFPAMSTIIEDAKIYAKNRLNTHKYVQADFHLYCLSTLENVSMIAEGYGQPAELGLRCRDTGITKDLELKCPEIVGHVIGVQKTFGESLRRLAISFVEDKDRECIKGFDHNVYMPEDLTVAAMELHIMSLTNLTNHEDDATSVHWKFTCDGQGRAYSGLHILAPLAVKVLQCIQGRGGFDSASLVDLFPQDYNKFPEELLSTICAWYVTIFRHKLRFGIAPKGKPHMSRRHFLADESHQLSLLRQFRGGTSDQSIRLNRWMNTPSEWQANLRFILALLNSTRGPKS